MAAVLLAAMLGTTHAAAGHAWVVAPSGSLLAAAATAIRLRANARPAPSPRARMSDGDDGYNSVFAFNSFGSADARQKWADPKVKASVIRALADALDNFRPAEVALVVERLWAAGPSAGAEGVSVQRLIELTERIEQLEQLAYTGQGDPYELGDEARTLRSRMRMYARDARLYPGDKDMPFWDML